MVQIVNSAKIKETQSIRFGLAAIAPAIWISLERSRRFVRLERQNAENASVFENKKKIKWRRKTLSSSCPEKSRPQWVRTETMCSKDYAKVDGIAQVGGTSASN